MREEFQLLYFLGYQNGVLFAQAMRIGFSIFNGQLGWEGPSRANSGDIEDSFHLSPASGLQGTWAESYC